MNSNTQIIIAVAVVLVLAVLGYVYWGGNATAPVATEPTTTQQQTQ
jgi:hypothetical protein